MKWTGWIVAITMGLLIIINQMTIAKLKSTIETYKQATQINEQTIAKYQSMLGGEVAK